MENCKTRKKDQPYAVCEICGHVIFEHGYPLRLPQTRKRCLACKKAPRPVTCGCGAEADRVEFYSLSLKDPCCMECRKVEVANQKAKTSRIARREAIRKREVLENIGWARFAEQWCAEERVREAKLGVFRKQFNPYF